MGELGRYPIEVTIKSRMIGNWYRLLTGKQTKLAYNIYQTMLRIPNFQSKWITCIQNILAGVFSFISLPKHELMLHFYYTLLYICCFV